MDGTDKQQYKFVGICLKLTIIVLQQLLYLVIRIQKNLTFDYILNIIFFINVVKIEERMQM